MAGGDNINIVKNITSSMLGLISAVVSMAPLSSAERIDEGMRRIDDVLRRIDGISPTTSEATSIVGLVSEGRCSAAAFSPSYPGQTKEDYCLECLERHFAKAHGLLEEAERFSLKYGRITPEAREKIRRAVEEIVTAEDDLGACVDDEELRRALDEIKVMQREVRKWMWARGLTTASESVEDLRAAKEMVRGLLSKAYEAAERYRSKGAECRACAAAGLPKQRE